MWKKHNVWGLLKVHFKANEKEERNMKKHKINQEDSIFLWP